MSKCFLCSKSITKKNLGLECSKCSVIVHSTPACTGLTKKQISSLKCAENLEWTCNDCSRKSPRRSSFIIPEDDADDDDEEAGSNAHYSIDMKKLLTDLTQEIHKIIKKELRETNTSLQYCSEKVDDFLECMEAFKDKIKYLEKKNGDLENKNKSLENKMAALQQRMNEYEQKELCNSIKIAGIPCEEKEDLEVLSKNLAKHLKVEVKDIKKIKRTHATPGKIGLIKLELQVEETKTKWIKQARTTHITVGHVNPNLEASAGKEKVYVREELTTHNKTLLWKAKQQCKDKYKFIWCKDGKIMVRKEEKSKIYIIRTQEDLKELLDN